MAVIDEVTPALTGWLTTSQASHRLEFSQNHVRRLAAEGRLRTIQTPHGILISPESVDELLRTRAAGSRDVVGGQ